MPGREGGGPVGAAMPWLLQMPPFSMGLGCAGRPSPGKSCKVIKNGRIGLLRLFHKRLMLWFSMIFWLTAKPAVSLQRRTASGITALQMGGLHALDSSHFSPLGLDFRIDRGGGMCRRGRAIGGAR
jgi:hypothetical protein